MTDFLQFPSIVAMLFLNFWADSPHEVMKKRKEIAGVGAGRAVGYTLPGSQEKAGMQTFLFQYKQLDKEEDHPSPETRASFPSRSLSLDLDCFCSTLEYTALAALHRSELQYSALRCDIWHCTALHCTALHCNAMQCNAMQCNAMQCNAMQCNAMQCNAMQCNAVQCNIMHSTALQCMALYKAVHK